MSSLVDVKVQYQGRWDGVLKSLGMAQEYFNGRHGDCPVCGDTRKNARWHPVKQYNICSKCGITGPMDLAMLLTGESFNETAKRIRGEKINMELTAKTQDLEKDTARLKSIYEKRKVLTTDCLAAQYLQSRGLTVLPQQNVFTVAESDYWTEQDGKWSKEVFPAMVSVIRNLAGETVSYHMTYLKDGKKHGRKVLPPIKPLQGASIQLFKPVDGVLAVAEGIETALAVHHLEGLPVWATGNAWQMEVLDIPADIKELHIYADSDKSFTGQQAAYTLAKRMAARGVNVRVHLLIGEYWKTDMGDGGDFLEFLNREQLGSADQ